MGSGSHRAMMRLRSLEGLEKGEELSVTRHLCSLLLSFYLFKSNSSMIILMTLFVFNSLIIMFILFTAFISIMFIVFYAFLLFIVSNKHWILILCITPLRFVTLPRSCGRVRRSRTHWDWVPCWVPIWVPFLRPGSAAGHADLVG